MEIKEFSDLVKEYFGYKMTFYCLNYDTKTIECILYDSFYFELSIGDRYGVFGAAIGIGNMMHSLTKVLGKDITLSSDRESIKSNLATIDNYCRIRLPDKFLNEFDRLKST
mgnify:CR=1 FL=1